MTPLRLTRGLRGALSRVHSPVSETRIRTVLAAPRGLVFFGLVAPLLRARAPVWLIELCCDYCGGLIAAEHAQPRH
jgi:hypothetical protein